MSLGVIFCLQQILSIGWRLRFDDSRLIVSLLELLRTLPFLV